MNMAIKWAAVPVLTVSTALAAAVAQSTPEGEAWAVDEGASSAWVTAPVGAGMRARLSVSCAYGSPRAALSIDATDWSDTPGESDPFLGGSILVETYADGIRTDSFGLDSMAAAEGPVSPQNLEALRQAEFIRVTGGRRPITFAAQRSAVAIGRVIAACTGEEYLDVNATTM